MTDNRQDVMSSYQTQFSDLCRELNMDRETEELSRKMFQEVLKRSTLEGDPLHWFCCALYAACRLSYTPTVGESNAVVMGNCISLNKLLRSCNMSISEFISKIKIWHDMANLPSTFLRQIEKLERLPGITFHLFRRYNEIFEKLFVAPRNEKRNTKYSTVDKCSSTKLYDICWCLYLCVKNENPNYNVDIVTSFHLLLCCIDLIYMNVLAENRVDLINPSFEGVPEHWGRADFNQVNVANHCIIEALCKLTDALSNDAMSMKKNYFKTIIRKFFQTNTIYGNAEKFLGILSNCNFERNVKSLNSGYEQFVLSVGEFDERILLKNTSYRKPSHSDGTDDTPAAHHQEIQPVNPHTPLTRKHSLPNEAISEPVASATNNVKKLQDIAKISEPSQFIRQAGDDTLKKIDDIKLSRMREVFLKNYPNDAEAANRFQMAKSLFYYLLDKILRGETKNKPNIDLKELLGTEQFITTLIACSVEIVLDAYKSQVKFPWILTCFNISAFHFYKIIEIVVRSHDGVLSRVLIKHLNSIEESCLESLAWQSGSPLWEIIKFNRWPTWSEVDVDNMVRRTAPQLQSPINSAYEMYHSSSVGVDSTRRDLFNTAAGCTFEMMFNCFMIAYLLTERKPPPSVDGRRRASSLPIFCRKFYKLAWIRMKELCGELNLDNEVDLNKLWNLFEHCIMQQTTLMKDRHLDQNIMCAIYLYIKVRRIEGKPFTDIMKFYRKQPQANSSTYREVLIESAGENGENMSTYRDIIYYYNTIFVQMMTPYAFNFREDRQQTDQNVPLSPHPTEKKTYPRKVSHEHQLYVSCMEKSEQLHSPTTLTYEFSKSPGKDLENFNNIISRGQHSLQFDNDDVVPRKRPRRNSNYIKILQDRQKESI